MAEHTFFPLTKSNYSPRRSESDQSSTAITVTWHPRSETKEYARENDDDRRESSFHFDSKGGFFSHFYFTLFFNSHLSSKCELFLTFLSVARYHSSRESFELTIGILRVPKYLSFRCCSGEIWVFHSFPSCYFPRASKWTGK